MFCRVCGDKELKQMLSLSQLINIYTYYLEIAMGLSENCQSTSSVETPVTLNCPSND